MRFIKPLNELSKNDFVIAGGKASSLGELINAKFPVPDGYVILTSAFEYFLNKNNIKTKIETIFGKINSKDLGSIESASKRIRKMIIVARIPKELELEIRECFNNLNSKFVAVRSSAISEDSRIAAWAGQLNSYINTNEESLLINIKNCWASLFTTHALLYGLENRLDKTGIDLAVIVQKMIQSDVSGVAFSSHPITGDDSQVVIEAGYGFGEAVVSGRITPDNYVVAKDQIKIINKDINLQKRALLKTKHGNEWVNLKNGYNQKLSNSNILSLSRFVIKIEKHYSFPCDIEWTKAKGKFYILQSRPITNKNVKLAVLLKPQNKYFLHFRQTEMPLLFNDICWRASNYGTMEYILLQEKDILTGYLTPKGMLQAREIGLKLLNNNFYRKTYYGLNKLKKERVRIPLKKAQKNNMIEYWNRLEKAINNICHWYFYCEQPVLAPLEDIISDIPEDYREKWKLFHKKNKVRLTVEQKKALYIIERFGRLKLEIHSNFSHVLEMLYSFADQVSKIYGIPEGQILFLRQKELIQLLRFNSFPSKTVFSARKNGIVLLSGKSREPIMLTGKRYKKWRNILKPLKTDIIFGSIAYSAGKVKGIVKLHLSLIKGQKIPKNSVVVTGMTNPQLIPFLKNATAIVTDEGGIMCHAAIISRELKIPCITGTEIATQILKDGDLVEVNTEDGFVKVIRRKD